MRLLGIRYRRATHHCIKANLPFLSFGGTQRLAQCTDILLHTRSCKGRNPPRTRPEVINSGPAVTAQLKGEAAVSEADGRKHLLPPQMQKEQLCNMYTHAVASLREVERALCDHLVADPSTTDHLKVTATSLADLLRDVRSQSTSACTYVTQEVAKRFADAIRSTLPGNVMLKLYFLSQLLTKTVRDNEFGGHYN